MTIIQLFNGVLVHSVQFAIVVIDFVLAVTHTTADTHRTVVNSIEAKKASIEKMKKVIVQLESDTEARLGEIDCSNAELKVYLKLHIKHAQCL